MIERKNIMTDYAILHKNQIHSTLGTKLSQKLMKKGKNKIESEVVNTWHNALRGADQGKAPYEGIWTNAKYRAKGDNLLPAGLVEQPAVIIEKK